MGENNNDGVITSYSIHYTKLYDITIPPEMLAVIKKKVDEGFYSSTSELVITSYSIHYTKLYEARNTFLISEFKLTPSPKKLGCKVIISLAISCAVLSLSDSAIASLRRVKNSFSLHIFETRTDPSKSAIGYVVVAPSGNTIVSPASSSLIK